MSMILVFGSHFEKYGEISDLYMPKVISLSLSLSHPHPPKTTKEKEGAWIVFQWLSSEEVTNLVLIQKLLKRLNTEVTDLVHIHRLLKSLNIVYLSPFASCVLSMHKFYPRCMFSFLTCAMYRTMLQKHTVELVLLLMQVQVSLFYEEFLFLFLVIGSLCFFWE